jgi:hypothetical protein
MEEFESMQAKSSTTQNSELIQIQGDVAGEETARPGNSGTIRLYEPGNRVDPFCSTELPMRADAHELFHHCEYSNIFSS